MSDRKRKRMTAGLILIAVGLGLFALERIEGVGEEAILIVIGGAFLIAYLMQRKYGLLIPGCILLGLGVGRIGKDGFWGFGDDSFLGLALGFIAIYVIARLYEGKTHWWPLIPGGILLLQAIPQTDDAFDYVLDHWQLILVLVGVLIVIASLKGSTGSE